MNLTINPLKRKKNTQLEVQKCSFTGFRTLYVGEFAGAASTNIQYFCVWLVNVCMDLLKL